MAGLTRLDARLNRRRLMAASGGAVLGATVLSRGALVTAQDSDVSATLVTDTAGIGDQNFNDLANAGGEKAASELGVEFSVLESQTQADYVSNLSLALEQSDVAVAVGFLLNDAVNEVAPQFPDKSIVFIDAVSENDNVQSVLFREHEGAFLGGILAGLATKTGKVGMVGGIRVPPVMRYEVGFAAGIKTINPAAQFTASYADDFEAPDLGKELTNALYDKDNDIVLQAAGRTGIGCFDAAKERGPGYWVIAGDTDQAHLGPDNQIGYVRKGVDTAVFQGIQAVVEGNFEGGIKDLGLAEDGMDFAGIHPSVDPAIAEAVAAYKQAIIDGTVTVPADDDQFAAFEPVVLETSATPAASPEASPAS
jgi:basic membrane protein A